MTASNTALQPSIWARFEELREGMDSREFGLHVLLLLFLKYVNDRSVDGRPSLIVVPEGAGFAELVALKGAPNIGERINKRIIEPLAKANNFPGLPDFARSDKWGLPAEAGDRLSRLIAVFENPALSFVRDLGGNQQRAAELYSYLLDRYGLASNDKPHLHTPREVARLAAQLLDIQAGDTAAGPSLYDPTCGSGALLLEVALEADCLTGPRVQIFGQDRDPAAVSLARMNILLHGYSAGRIRWGNTLKSPLFREGEGLRTFDVAVCHPPFLDVKWSDRLDAENDRFGRFEGYGIPPSDRGDYAYLLHVLHSLNDTGRALCILPFDVLSRGGADAGIRRALIGRGVVQAVIGLPEKLLPGDGTASCMIILDRSGAAERSGVFLIDASRDFVSEGGRNRLADEHITRIAEAFREPSGSDAFARMVPVDEILAAEEADLTPSRYLLKAELQPARPPFGEVLPAFLSTRLFPLWRQAQKRGKAIPALATRILPLWRQAQTRSKAIPAAWGFAIGVGASLILAAPAAYLTLSRPGPPAVAEPRAAHPEIVSEIESSLDATPSYQALKSYYRQDYDGIVDTLLADVLGGSPLPAALADAPGLKAEVMRRESKSYGMASLDSLREDLRARLPVMRHLKERQGARACSEFAVNGAAALLRFLGEGYAADSELTTLTDGLTVNFFRTAAEGRKLQRVHQPLDGDDWPSIARALLTKGMTGKDFDVFTDPARSVDDPATCDVFIRFIEIVTAPGNDETAALIPSMATAAAADE
jgi:type I restriction-modification system DNA methylase subunit